MIKFFSIIFSFIALNLHPVYAALYSIEDLEQLQISKNYTEFLNHAHDIRPSSRDKRWREMVQTMAVGQLDFLLEKRIFNQESFKLIEKIALWPILLEDEFFQIKRNRFAEFYLENCFSKRGRTDSCKNELLNFWNASNQNPDLAMSLVNILKSFTKEKDFWGFYQKVTKSSSAEFYCPKIAVRKSILDHLRVNLSQVEDPKYVKKFIDDNLGSTCWQSVLKDLKGMLFDKSFTLRSFAYKALNSKEALTQVEQDSYLAFYILTNPIKGDTFNVAWSLIEKVGDDYSRRMKVFKVLKNIDPLPGDIFSNYNKEKKEAIINLFANNFPEYIDHYARTCVNFLKGIGDFPRGNPTLYCSELYSSSKSKRWIRQPLQIQYSSIKK
ncbi:hypothetical protein BIY24_09675 [Halobacteriovorax marinus]|uniref:hypothetical protein n=1 Tax=Halobacteriovorax marinus TaxID=97084 RepID=UPI000BC2E580|nr:hypothetical protein [Halobacteriovorax marinus]ATH08208.1 hypothetical protein BIY24_09675 [Halobacteriovorax marinus]